MWPVIKVEIHTAKLSFMGCKWSNLTAPGTGTPVSHSRMGFGNFSFPNISPMGEEMASQYESEKVQTFVEKMS